jgi:hypothetical protein
MADDPENFEFPKEIPPPPPWSEEVEVAAWAYRMLRAHDNEAEYEHARYYSGRHDIAGIPVSSIYGGVEREAVKRAEVGDFKPLAGLLHPDHPMNRHPIGKKTLRESLTPETWSLITLKLVDLVDKGRGRPPETEEKRRATNPIHNAADEVQAIEDILRANYPEQSAEQIRTAACNAVAQQTGIKANSLDNYLSRPPDDPRRLPRRR